MDILLSYPSCELLKRQVPSQLLKSIISPDNIVLFPPPPKRAVQMDLSCTIPTDINGSNLPKTTIHWGFFKFQR